jgi:prepilin-type processing-associated H-X9-DG protein
VLSDTGDGQANCPDPFAMLRWAPFHVEFGAKLSQITDGTAKTLAMMEMTQTEAAASNCDRRSRIWCEKPGCHMLMTRNPPNSPKPDEGNCRTDLIDAPCVDMTVAEARYRSHNASRSRHPGGVNVLMCDSSAHFVRDDIELEIWRAMSSMAGGETYTTSF